MDKTAAKKAAAALREIGRSYGLLKESHDRLAEKVAAYERRDEVLKVAQIAVEKGVDGRPLMEVAEHLENMYIQSKEAFDKYAGAVSLIVPNMGQRLASLHDQDVGSDVHGNRAALHQAILGE